MYRYLEHQADMGIYAQGKTWQKVFEEGAKAVFELMYEKKLEIRNQKLGKIKIKVMGKDVPSLFIEWLNELLAQKDIENLVFTAFKINKLAEENGQYVLKAEVRGEEIDRKKFEPKLEVKAATYSGLKCGERDREKFCQCVVDV